MLLAEFNDDLSAWLALALFIISRLALSRALNIKSNG
jgi:hypothetical protein